MIDQVLRYTLPQAYELLPPVMRSPASTAMLLAIGLQESQFEARRQVPTGPARGFWQFEAGGVRGVMSHQRTRSLISGALVPLRYAHLVGEPDRALEVLEHHDALAAVFARCLLWSLPQALPLEGEDGAAWEQYLDAWRPGTPRPETWLHNFGEGWLRARAFHR